MPQASLIFLMSTNQSNFVSSNSSISSSFKLNEGMKSKVNAGLNNMIFVFLLFMPFFTAYISVFSNSFNTFEFSGLRVKFISLMSLLYEDFCQLFL